MVRVMHRQSDKLRFKGREERLCSKRVCLILADDLARQRRHLGRNVEEGVEPQLGKRILGDAVLLHDLAAVINACLKNKISVLTSLLTSNIVFVCRSLSRFENH